MSDAVLVGCSHGTDDRAGRAAIGSILADVAARRPDLDVREAFVDVQEPEVADVVRDALASGAPAVVVPLLLSVGFHVRVDVTAAVEPEGACAAAPLGPDDVLVDILLDRLAAAGLTDDDALVLAAAGSTDPAAAAAVEQVAASLAARLGRHVGPPDERGGGLVIGYGAGAVPRLRDAVATARTGARRVVVASYLLAPGFFLGRVRAAGADVVSAPLAPDPRLADLVLRRYDEARGA
ncbi:sirohydrochlorin chelatase [Cellulomonas gilvus]|uniref:Cobalamin (Vitamin B12) biosynthesis CbiX protein n=1 Tax=Cellulomonas gilvus (strain ATCC 13127 / NRRL B-14078) TaxID=593907 RepID=F8A0T2_CELGA|nr:CbiX/SirB N-terminal domain-containing protein [Cellulomonas gilvus]AEI11554.1 cobalamin (vitamin B12) biosynthesis CbiX protein [Cellulomonas gilvus ATCC 13127]